MAEAVTAEGSVADSAAAREAEAEAEVVVVVKVVEEVD